MKRIGSAGRTCRHGYVLLVVLWAMVGIVALGLTLSLAAREAVATAHNRANRIRAAWQAEDCMAIARVVIEHVLADHTLSPTSTGWARLDEHVRTAPALTARCKMTIRAAGVKLNVNTADATALKALFAAVRIAPARADSLADALLDWRDPDDLPRPFGAEREWYAAHGRIPPRNGRLADIRELRRVRGFEDWRSVDTLLDVEPGRIPLNHAPAAVLAAVPGFTGEAVQRVEEHRRRGTRLESVVQLMGELSPPARDTMTAYFPEVASRVVIEPDAWILASRARAGNPPITAVLEVRLVRAGQRAAIVRRRTWVE